MHRSTFRQGLFIYRSTILSAHSVQESPRWLTTKGRSKEAIETLAHYRDLDVDDVYVRNEYAEIEAAIVEEREARRGLGLREAFLGKGNGIRFFIAFFIFLLQQFCGQNSVGYYAPQIFTSVCSLSLEIPTIVTADP